VLSRPHPLLQIDREWRQKLAWHVDEKEFLVEELTVKPILVRRIYFVMYRRFDASMFPYLLCTMWKIAIVRDGGGSLTIKRIPAT
jgi:hypothetical protein